MKYKVIACGVFEPYLKHLALECPNEIDVEALDAGLHSRPNDLRLLAQAEIDKASRSGGYDAVILLYGLCGRGTANLLSRDIPVVIPRAHDCITLFLGSHEAYLRQFNKNPGTFYHTLGWIQKKINPKNREAAELYSNYVRDGWEHHPDFKSLEAQYGRDNAEHVVAFMERWRQHYTRAAYIDMGFPDEDVLIEFTRDMSRIFEWDHEVIQGDPDLLRRLLAGDWSDERVFVLPPNSRSVSSGDEKIFAVASIDGDDNKGRFSSAEVLIESADGAGAAGGIGLGIDAGGTYTDAVIMNLSKNADPGTLSILSLSKDGLGGRQVLAKAKSLTTYHNLVEGIRGALSQLPGELLQQVQVTSLSTTLATNSIVEGRGHKVGLIALSPWDWTEEQLGHSPLINVPGAVAITGEVITPLDDDACRAAVKRLVEDEHCAALVIAGYATVRNPEVANRAREIASEMTDVPVICSHEVSRRINGIHAAQTAVANATLIPVIRSLIDSVHAALADFHVPGKLMVVKGDGSPVDESIARARPVETILSGPAASVAGARILTGLDNALVLDVGGTTTDCAIIENGHVAVSPEGARIGSWTMSVDAVEISTAGLGGDSRIDFTADRSITVGPVRNIPFAYLAHEHKSVQDFLASFDTGRVTGMTDASVLDVLVLSHSVKMKLTDRERVLVDILKTGPTPVRHAAVKMELPSHILLPTSRLEACGMVKRAALTPTDLLHVTGKFTRWDAEASKRALEIFAAMYGRPADEVLEQAMLAVTRRLFDEIVRREVSWENRKLHDLPEAWKFLLDKAFDNHIGTVGAKHLQQKLSTSTGLTANASPLQGLGVTLTLGRPVIAIGAPAEALVPAVSKHLMAEIIVPEHADVANAIGAIGSEIVVREEILIRPGHLSNYVLHGAEERIEFRELEKATLRAIDISRSRARNRAIEAGAIAPEVTVSRSDRAGSVADGGQIFLERRVTAVASGGAFG
jgi:N-methylhydantoinase A/oxoprolinase/acetone carboxylase beta subunit